MAMACFASAGLSFSVLVRSRTVQVVAPRVSLRKLSSAAAGTETLPVWEAERIEVSYADHRVIERARTARELLGERGVYCQSGGICHEQINLGNLIRFCPG